MRQFSHAPLDEEKGRVTLHEQIRARVGRLAPFPHHMIETEVELVVSQELSDESPRVSLCARAPKGQKLRAGHLFRRLEGRARRVLIGFGVVDFEGGKHGVLEADVDADDRVDDGSWLVSLERGRDGQVGGGILSGSRVVVSSVPSSRQ